MNPLKINVILHPLLLLICGLLCCVPSLVSAKIVFCVNGDIFVSNDDGSRRRRLTQNTTALDEEPRWSPDGTKITFTRFMEGKKEQTTAEVFIINADGTDPQRLTHNNVLDSGSSWSPDGSEIAFSSDRSGDWGVCIIDVATRAVRQITDAPSATPDFSPDGSQIVFERFIDIANGISPKTIYVMDADGQHQRRVLPDPPVDGPPTFRYFPRFSSDGERILFYEDKWFKEGDVLRLFVQRIGGRRTVITDINDRLDGNFLIAGASWMHDDRAIVLAIKRFNRSTPNYDLYRYTFDTRGLRRLTRDATDEEWPDWIAGALSVAPHGKMTTLWGEIKTDGTDGHRR